MRRRAVLAGLLAAPAAHAAYPERSLRLLVG